MIRSLGNRIFQPWPNDLYSGQGVVNLEFEEVFRPALTSPYSFRDKLQRRVFTRGAELDTTLEGSAWTYVERFETSNCTPIFQLRESRQLVRAIISAVSKPIFAAKYSICQRFSRSTRLSFLCTAPN